MIGLLPRPTGSNLANDGLRDIESRGYSALRARCHSDHVGLFDGEFSGPMAFAGTGSGAPFGDHIGRVLGMRSESQMIWVDAGRRVASVANAHLAGDRTEFRFPYDAMREAVSPLPPNRPISAPGLRATPDVAAILVDGDLRGDALRERFSTVNLTGHDGADYTGGPL